MAKRTFRNLPESKQKQFLDVALKEFSQKDYDSASITHIVRVLGIAKGSVYQYFDDKRDLWKYLKQYADERRLNWVKDLYRSDYPDFYAYFRAMQDKHRDFFLQDPDAARFLFRVHYLECGGDVQGQVAQWKKHQISIFRKLIEAEKLIGTLNTDINVQAAALFLSSLSQTVQNYCMDSHAESLPTDKKQNPDEKQIDKKSVISRLTGALSSKKGDSGQPDGTNQSSEESLPYEELMDDLTAMLKRALT